MFNAATITPQEIVLTVLYSIAGLGIAIVRQRARCRRKHRNRTPEPNTAAEHLEGLAPGAGAGA